MFSLHDFVLSAVLGMVGNYPDWQVREYALGWFSKGVISQDDLATVDAAIAALNPPPAEVLPDTPTADVVL